MTYNRIRSWQQDQESSNLLMKDAASASSPGAGWLDLVGREPAASMQRHWRQQADSSVGRSSLPLPQELQLCRAAVGDLFQTIRSWPMIDSSIAL
ncbi:uncharacterized protein LJ206_015904 isoform 1-T1 [Theristicus caerulescens]